MIIGILSDTHDDLEAMRKAIKILGNKGAELIIHCGDWVSPSMVEDFEAQLRESGVNGKCVWGNNDVDLRKEVINGKKFGGNVFFSTGELLNLDIDNKKIAVYHGDNKTTLKKLFNSKEYDVVLFGHTHVPKKEQENGTLLLNPGSASPRIAKSKHLYGSVAIYDTKSNEAELVDTVP